MKPYKPSPAAITMLCNIAHGHDIAHGIPGRRPHSGGTTKIAIWKRGLVNSKGLTTAGIDVLRAKQFEAGRAGGNVAGGAHREEWEKYRDAIHAASVTP